MMTLTVVGRIAIAVTLREVRTADNGRNLHARPRCPVHRGRLVPASRWLVLVGRTFNLLVRDLLRLRRGCSSACYSFTATAMRPCASTEGRRPASRWYVRPV